MDPLSITASIAALSQTAAFITKCAKNIKNASSEQELFKVELEHLIALLQTLRRRVEEAPQDSPWLAQVTLCVRDGLFDQLQRRLKSLESKIRQDNASRPRFRARFRARLLWIIEKDDLQSALSSMERPKSIISLALQNDSFDLTLAIKADTAKAVQSLTELQAESQSKCSQHCCVSLSTNSFCRAGLPEGHRVVEAA